MPSASIARGSDADCMNWFKQLFQKVTVSQAAEPSSEPAANKATVEEMHARFGHLARPAVQLRPADETPFSKLGGLPQLPDDIVWPVWNGKPQAFLAQLDLAEVHAALPS